MENGRKKETDRDLEVIYRGSNKRDGVSPLPPWIRRNEMEIGLEEECRGNKRRTREDIGTFGINRSFLFVFRFSLSLSGRN